MVQRVGFRRYAELVARKSSIYGSIQNLADGSVKIVAQGTGANLEKFVGEIRRAPEPIIVDSVMEKEKKVSSRLEQFSIITGPLAKEMLEGFGAMQSEFGNYRQEFRDYKGEFRDFNGEFRDYRNEFRDYRQEFKDFSQGTYTNFNKLDAKYAEISDKLTQILDELRTENREAIKSLDRSVDALLRAIEKLPAQNH